MSQPNQGGARTPARRRRPSTSSFRSGGSGASRSPRVPVPAPRSDLDLALDAAQALEAPEPRTFAELGLPKPLVAALGRQGVNEPFAIQSRVLPDALAGRDILGRAQTGSGKTLAFGLPMLTRLAGSSAAALGDKGVDSATHQVRRTPGAPRALVLVPTRELALQVCEALAPLSQGLGLKVLTIYGGAPYGRQLDGLARGVDIVIATPGRLVDLIERRSCRLDQVEISVIDEADYMGDLGFLPVVTGLLEQTKAGGQRMLFSATLDRGVDTLVRRFLTDPAVHAVASASAPVDSMEHRVFTVDRADKVAVATEVAGRPGRTLFFVRTKHGADRLATQFGRAGVDAAAIHGNLGQGARQRALAAFAEGSTRVLVATDVAARGIHVDGVDLVVHFDPPNDHKDYLHRSGRTARAGASGTVVALVLPDERRTFARLHEAAQVSPQVHDVGPGHPAVREVATSGEPIVVRPRPVRSADAIPTGGGRPRRSGSGGSGGSGRGGYSGGRRPRGA